MTGSLQIKNGRYFAVLNFKDKEGKRKQKWINLNLEIKNNKGNEIETVVFLTVNYGFRRSEVLGLKWDAVDFQSNTISVHHTALSKTGGTLYDDTTKNQSSMRTLPLTSGVRDYLLKLKEHQEEMRFLFGNCYTDNDYICKFDDGHLFRPDYVSHKFKVALQKSELPVIRFHDLRHSAASFLIKAGFNLKEIQEWMGHSDIATTGNIYSYLQYSSKVNMAEKINNALEDFRK